MVATMVKRDLFRVSSVDVWVEPIEDGCRLTVGDSWDAIGEEYLSFDDVDDLIRRLEMAKTGTYPVPLRVNRSAKDAS